MAMRARSPQAEYTQRVREVQATNPLRKKALIAHMQRHPNYEVTALHRLMEEARGDIADQPTSKHLAVQMPMIAKITGKITRPMLPFDARSRPYLRVRDNNPDTIKLIEQAVEEYISFEGAYPAEIVLNRLRYLHVGFMAFFYPPHTNYQIPYVLEEELNCDVIARGYPYYPWY